ncbi:hypothetical protein [Rhodoferax aquaticus]|uniref:Uncharacterized protein n=1 Tax=Rhodoferax aquaticus TaxID=2527691 RepID=A0A515EPW4_9BURK|nr:hypothetical protein [Rhodoferax aquaticus]QDL54675.1 hypothetical protein EXZ61_11125 [Rhodoferax aquaticus]
MRRVALRGMRLPAVAAVLALAVVLACSACTRAQPEAAPTTGQHTMKQEVSIQLGMSGQDFAIALGREDARITKQPAGLNFYAIHWPARLPGKVNVNHGVHSFSLNAALSVQGVEDVDRLVFGVDEFSINFGITPADLIPHDEARLQVMALLKRLQDAGWKQNYGLSSARLKGRSSLQDTLSLDARYTPLFEEWMALGNSASWELQASGVYMELSMRRDSDRMDPYRPGAYLMSMTLKTEEAKCRLLFDEADRGNWKEIWSDKAKQFKEWRFQRETQARAKGLEIDTQYQDPAILALKKD